jgi:hypothetical protein
MALRFAPLAAKIPAAVLLKRKKRNARQSTQKPWKRKRFADMRHESNNASEAFGQGERGRDRLNTPFSS